MMHDVQMGKKTRKSFSKIREVLDMLPLNLNRVLSLIYVSGLNRAEVARRMKASRTTVYRYQEQGMAMVEKILDSREAA
mgnify:CR=1 FL=1